MEKVHREAQISITSLSVSLNQPNNKPPDSPYLLSFLSTSSLLPLCSCITLFFKPPPAFNISTALFRDTDSMPNVIALISVHLSKCHNSNLLQAYIVCFNKIVSRIHNLLCCYQGWFSLQACNMKQPVHIKSVVGILTCTAVLLSGSVVCI